MPLLQIIIANNNNNNKNWLYWISANDIYSITVVVDRCRYFIQSIDTDFVVFVT